MKFNEDLGLYCFENEGIIFAWDYEPADDFMQKVITLSKNYHAHINEIATYILQELEGMYGEINVEEVKANLGNPIIEYERGVVTYCEQTFDDMHIFEFEFLDDQFETLQYFAVNG